MYIWTMDWLLSGHVGSTPDPTIVMTIYCQKCYPTNYNSFGVGRNIFWGCCLVSFSLFLYWLMYVYQFIFQEYDSYCFLKSWSAWCLKKLVLYALQLKNEKIKDQILLCNWKKKKTPNSIRLFKNKLN